MSGRGAIEPTGKVQEMFGRIAPRYDLMNRLMTGGQDVRWRKMTVKLALAAGAERVLDVATGTGDLALALRAGGATEVVGLDFAPPMIALAEEKRDGRDGVSFLVGNAMALPFPDGAFDAVTIAFGLRNLPSYMEGLREMARVLRPGGRLVVLEMTPLTTPVIAPLFRLYFENVVPLVGGWLSGDRSAYRYLPSSVAAFPDAEALAAMMREAGFAAVTVKKVGGGTVALHLAVRAR